MTNLDADCQETGKLFTDYKTLIEKEYLKVDILIEKLKARVLTLIEELRVELLEDLKNNLDNNLSSQTIEELYKDLESRRSNAMGEKDKDNFDSVRESFAEKLSQIASKKQDIKANIETLSSRGLNPNAVDTFDFKKFLKFGIRIPSLIKPKVSWKWNDKINEALKLSDDHMTVERIDPNSNSYAPAFGDMLLKEGFHQWKMTIDTQTPGKDFIWFGIVEDKNSQNMFYMNPKLIYGMNSTGYVFQMNVSNKLDSYDTKTFTCLLDFESSSFSILHEKTVLCENKTDIAGKKFYPVCILYSFKNKVTLVPNEA